MKEINRRGFLKLAGAGSAVAAASAAIPAAGYLADVGGGGTYSFRAVAGLPKRPLPSYASLVLEGTIDLVRKTGLVTRSVMAGHPGAQSAIALPGLSQIVRVTDVKLSGATMRLTGRVDDRSQLKGGESPFVEILIDRAQRTGAASFQGHRVVLQLMA